MIQRRYNLTLNLSTLEVKIGTSQSKDLQNRFYHLSILFSKTEEFNITFIVFPVLAHASPDLVLLGCPINNSRNPQVSGNTLQEIHLDVIR